MSTPCLVAEWSGAVEVDALSRVRKGTRRRHRQLDRESSLARLTFHNCSVAEYRAAMAPLASAYARADRILASAQAYRPSDVSPYRLRSPLIGLALSALRDPLPGPTGTGPRIDSTAAYLGCRYVVDGAQFGHTVIARALARSPVASTLPDSALLFWRTRFLAIEDWRRLCARLANIPTRSGAAAATVAARLMFGLFQSCFAEATGKVGN